jgi:hypothetical protein
MLFAQRLAYLIIIVETVRKRFLYGTNKCKQLRSRVHVTIDHRSGFGQISFEPPGDLSRCAQHLRAGCPSLSVGCSRTRDVNMYLPFGLASNGCMTTPIFGLWIEQGLNTVTRSALAESPVCSTSFCDDIGGLSPVLVPALQAGLPTGPKRKTPDPRRTLALAHRLRCRCNRVARPFETIHGRSG